MIFLYGPTKMIVEQVNNGTGTVTYLHHDQAGSTLAVDGECAHGAYGIASCRGCRF